MGTVRRSECERQSEGWTRRPGAWPWPTARSPDLGFPYRMVQIGVADPLSGKGDSREMVVGVWGPISRRLGEAHGILSSWRRLLDQQILGSVSRLEGPSESATQEINDIRQHDHLSGLALASRMRARRFQIEALSRPDGSSTSPPDNGLTGNNPSEILTGNNALLERLAGSNSRRLELLERLAFGIANTAGAMSDDFRRIASPNQYRGSASSSNLQNNEPAVDGARIAGAPSADQASNSSTVAVIQGDGGISESAGEPSNAGSSGSLRRRGRSNASGSLDVDGGSLQQNKRHRMN